MYMPSMSTYLLRRRHLELEYQFLSAGDGNEGRIVTTPEMLNLQWTSVVLFPAGHFVGQVTFEPSIRLPDGWQFATALETASASGPSTTFKPVSLEALVDSPVFAGRYVKRVDLGAPELPPVRLNVFADRADLLEAKPEHLEAHRALVTQAHRLFNSHHYDRYDFLLALSDRMGGIGLEHHRSSENATAPNLFHRVGQGSGYPTAVAARIRPLLERQVQTARRFVDGELQRAHAQQPAVGL